ncbi:MAG: repair protein RadC [Neobacillus sp.]|jgi:DNA repair protein RadC|nr:repair protein RadC [Neobacillus sp.]
MKNIFEIQRIKQVKVESELETFFVRSPDDAVDAICHYIGDEDREVFLVLVLTTKNEVVAVHRCHLGNINSSIVDPRDVFKAAILNNGTSILVAHNHPSGVQDPSREDREITRRLAGAGRILGVQLLDHIVIGGNSDKFYSFKQHGEL